MLWHPVLPVCFRFFPVKNHRELRVKEAAPSALLSPLQLATAAIIPPSNVYVSIFAQHRWAGDTNRCVYVARGVSTAVAGDHALALSRRVAFQRN